MTAGSVPAWATYDWSVQPPSGADTWVGLTDEPLPVGAAADWAVRPDCGAMVLFSGTVRDHAEHRTNVTKLVYEAYAEQVEPRLLAIAEQARTRWPVGRLALLHRTGELGLGESSVVVVASSAHRGDAFEAARFCIDTLKATVPIWKRETWEGGEDWGLCAHDVVEVDDMDAHQS
ncbi:MAG: molybdopterin synthase large subunit MoaE [Actinomycetia bacterium]|nr:molybdopterin synthase large subunit MoaE [Actinomycetes bacterium]